MAVGPVGQAAVLVAHVAPAMEVVAAGHGAPARGVQGDQRLRRQSCLVSRCLPSGHPASGSQWQSLGQRCCQLHLVLAERLAVRQAGPLVGRLVVQLEAHRLGCRSAGGP